MQSYELTYILPSSLTTDEAANAQKDIEGTIQSKEGVILKSEKTGVKMLAYPIKKHTSGYFCMVELQMPENKLKEFKDTLEKGSPVLRHLILVKRPARIVKERRTRKPVGTETPASFLKTSEDKKKGEKVQTEEIEKKLDEILSE